MHGQPGARRQSARTAHTNHGAGIERGPAQERVVGEICRNDRIEIRRRKPLNPCARSREATYRHGSSSSLQINATSPGADDARTVLKNLADVVRPVGAGRNRPTREAADFLAQPGFVLPKKDEDDVTTTRYTERLTNLFGSNPATPCVAFRKAPRIRNSGKTTSRGTERRFPTPAQRGAEEREDEINVEGTGGAGRQALQDRRDHDVRDVERPAEAGPCCRGAT
jgi:hypothetical protein